MNRLRRSLAVFGLAALLLVSTSGCVVVRGRRGCHSHSFIPAIVHCADACFRVCR